jgi:hypothetical protein
MAEGSPRYIYRGTNLAEANEEEFADGRVAPSTVPIQSIDFPPTETALNYHNQSLLNHGDLLTGSETVSVTGGFTPSLSAALKFTKRVNPPGVLLILDRTRIPEQLVPIEYDLSWFNDNPGALAHTMSVEEGEVREDGRLVALLLNADTKKTLNNPRGRGLEYQATKRVNADEKEAVAFADGVSISNAIEQVVVYRAVRSGELYTMRNTLEKLGPYSNRKMGLYSTDTGDQVANTSDDNTVAGLLYDEIAERMMYPSDALMIVGVRGLNEIVKERTGVTEQNFVLSYDGTSVNRDYRQNHPALQRE